MSGEKKITALSRKNKALKDRCEKLSEKNRELNDKVTDLEDWKAEEIEKKNQQKLDNIEKAATKTKSLQKTIKTLRLGAGGAAAVGICSAVIAPVLMIPSAVIMASLVIKEDKLSEEAWVLENYPEALHSDKVKKEAMEDLRLRQLKNRNDNTNSGERDVQDLSTNGGSL